MKRVYLHPLPVRIWHWAYALIVIGLIITGIQIHVPGIASIRPQDPALVLHKFAGWAMTGAWLFWLIYGLFSGNIKQHYFFRKKDFGGIFKQAKYYLISIFKGEESPFQPAPEEKFNPLQKVAYNALMFILCPVIIVTGVLFSNIDFLRSYVLLWDVAGPINAIHLIGLYVFLLFLVAHLYLVTLGRTFFSHTKAMIVGYEEELDAHQDCANPIQDDLACSDLQKE
jgi:thiosulfate reductase cytochrome b subunit